MYKTINPKNISQGSLNHYLLSAVAPRPICFASTIDKAGNVNLGPFSFFNVFSFNPPIMIFSVVRRGRDNTTKHTYQNIMEVKEVVINVVTYPIVEQMSLTSMEYAKGVNEFVKAGLTQVDSQQIRPPRVGEAAAAFECVVEQVIELGEGPGAGILIVAKVVLMHFQETYLNEKGNLDIPKLDLVARMGGSWYCRATPEALFEIPKPLKTKGIGVDQLPKHIRNSSILTGNNLGRLANVEALPTKEIIQEFKKSADYRKLGTDLLGNQEAIHKLAKKWLAEDIETEKVLTLLLCRDNS